MELEMIDGPQGPQRCEDGGGHLVTAGEAIAKGDVLIADYTDDSGIAEGISPNTTGYPETIFVKLATSTATVRKQSNTLLCIAKEAAASGEKLRVSFKGYNKITIGTTVTAGFVEVGYNTTNGATRAAAVGDMIFGRTTGVALATTAPGPIWFDGTNVKYKAV